MLWGVGSSTGGGSSGLLSRPGSSAPHPPRMASSTIDAPPASPPLAASPVARASAGFRSFTVAERIAYALTAIFFLVLFYQPITTLAIDWWTVPEAGHGLLLAPVAIWFAWKSGFLKNSSPNVALGVTMLVVAVLVRFASGMAAELF